MFWSYFYFPADYILDCFLMSFYSKPLFLYFFFLMIRPPPRSPLFPSTPLFRSPPEGAGRPVPPGGPAVFPESQAGDLPAHGRLAQPVGAVRLQAGAVQAGRPGLPGLLSQGPAVCLHPGRAQDARPAICLQPTRPVRPMGVGSPAGVRRRGR